MVTTEFSQMPDDEVESQLQQEDTASTLTPNAKPSSKASARSRGKIISLAKVRNICCETWIVYNDLYNVRSSSRSIVERS